MQIQKEPELTSSGFFLPNLGQNDLVWHHRACYVEPDLYTPCLYAFSHRHWVKVPLVALYDRGSLKINLALTPTGTPLPLGHGCVSVKRR
jgi:hypothetical protein